MPGEYAVADGLAEMRQLAHEAIDRSRGAKVDPFDPQYQVRVHEPLTPKRPAKADEE